MTKEQQEQDALTLAGTLTQTYIEAITCIMTSSDTESIRIQNKMLLAVRDADLAKVDAIEKRLGISPTTAEIRRWYKNEKRLNNGETWIRERS